MRSHPLVDTKVELTADAFGYPAGSRGTVVRSFHHDDEAVYVRFEETGHTLLIALANLAPVSASFPARP